MIVNRSVRLFGVTALMAGWACTWRQYLAESDEANLSKAMLRHENTGRPLGERSFLERVGAILGRDLTRKKPGPKPKKGN